MGIGLGVMLPPQFSLRELSKQPLLRQISTDRDSVRTISSTSDSLSYPPSSRRYRVSHRPGEGRRSQSPIPWGRVHTSGGAGPSRHWRDNASHWHYHSLYLAQVRDPHLQ